MNEIEHRTKISMVSYQNTIPFIKGLNESSDFEVIKDIPSKCLDYFINEEVDISLVPVGSLSDIENNMYDIVTDYCIGCDGAVRTVCLFSDTPVQSIKSVKLDSHSRTSIRLARILLRDYWKVNPSYIQNYKGAPNLISGEGIVMIGDKVFENEGKFKYSYDLGEVWKKHTGLPFVFAVWIARKNVDLEVREKLNNLLKNGVKNIDFYTFDQSNLSHEELKEYFIKYIDYDFDERKKKAMKLFLALL